MFDLEKMLIGVLALAMAVGGGFVFLSFLKRSQKRIRYDLLFSANLLVSFGLGCGFSALKADAMTWTEILRKNDIRTNDVLIALGVVVLFVSFIMFLGSCVKGSTYLSTERLRRSCAAVIDSRWVGWILIAGAGLVIFAVSKGMAGAATTLEGEVSPLTLIVDPLVTVLLPICILRAVMAPRFFTFLGLGIQCMGSIWFGRWNFILMLANGLLLLMAAGVTRRKLISVCVIAAVLLPFGFALIFAVRLSSYAGDRHSMDIVQLGRDAVYIAVTGGDGKTSFSNNLSSNTDARPFYHTGYLALVARNGLPTFEGANGELVISSMFNAVPSFISDAKQSYLDAGEEEGLTMRTFHITTSDDEANTILTGALTDFGVLGMVIYPMMVIGLMLIFVVLAKANPDPLCYLMSVVATTHFLMTAESTLTGWFLNIRFLLMLLAAGFTVSMWRRLRRAQRPQAIWNPEPNATLP